MMKRALVNSTAILCLLIFLTWSPAQANEITAVPTSHEINVDIPPLPETSANERVIAIVILKEALAKHGVEKLLSDYPTLKLRYVYKHALDGFSIEGTRKDIAAIKQEAATENISEISTYKADGEDSIPFIGGDIACGLLDDNNQRLTGKGVTVGVIDTGIDYTHPDLRSSYKGGRDLVDGDRDPMETKDEGDSSTLHGTHVAGIIAANGRMKGVAPEADIMAYRALGPGGVGDTEQVLAAIDAAIEDQVDVLNLSLGNNVNGPDLPISLALNKAVESGIVAVTSNGNSGPGVWTVGSPGTAEKAISVGASTPPLSVPYIITGLGSNRMQTRLIPLEGSRDWNLHFTESLVDGGIGKEDELHHVRGKIALIKRGKLTFSQKVTNAEKAGAEAVIIYNNTKGGFSGNLEEKAKIPAASISKEAGRALKEMLDKEETLSIRFANKKEQDKLADFSSRGPVTVTWGIKPDLLAPGVAIESTVPSGYLSLQGTSMAAPHVAGACALILQAHPKWTPEQVKSALMTTSKPLSGYRTYEQGAGRIQIDKAIKADTLLKPNSLSLGMFEKKIGIAEHESKVTIENTGKEPKRYSFRIPKKEKGITWDLPQTFYVGPGEKKQITIGLQVDPKIKTGIYDGYLNLMEESNEISLPFLYVKEEPNYPRVMGFELGAGDSEETYRYEMYLPGGADEYGIALYDADSFRFVGFLDWGKNAAAGLIKKDIKMENIPPKGVYNIIVFAKKYGKEDRIDVTMLIE